MKIARVKNSSGDVVYAGLAGDELFELSGDIYGEFELTNKKVEPAEWLSPIDPQIYFCIAANYKAHVDECDLEVPKEPKIFMKNSACAVGHNQAIRIPAVCDDEVDYEGELAVVIGKPCCNVKPENVKDYILGYSVCNDVSARIWQLERGDGQWVRGKSFDTFGPLGPYLVTKDEIADPHNLNIRTVLNGEVVQESSTARMIHSVEKLISFLCQDTTLLPGTVILTGTPEGVGWAREPKLTLKNGDEITVEVESVGKLTNPVV